MRATETGSGRRGSVPPRGAWSLSWMAIRAKSMASQAGRSIFVKPSWNPGINLKGCSSTLQHGNGGTAATWIRASLGWGGPASLVAATRCGVVTLRRTRARSALEDVPAGLAIGASPLRSASL